VLPVSVAYAQGPVAYFSFDNAADLGHDYAGANSATSVVNVTGITGKRNGGAHFVNGYLLLPNTAALKVRGGDFTLSVFVRASSTAGNRNWFTKSTSTTHQYGLGGNTTVGIGFDGGPGGGAASTSVVMNGSWHHVAGIKRGTNAEIWIDGQLQATGATNGTADTGAFAIGRDGECCEYFNGDMDEAKVWNRALSATEIATEAGVTPVCTLGCTAIVPGTGTTTTAVTFIGSASTTGTCSTPTYEWTFGDSSANTTVQNPTHLYQKPGTYAWSLSVSSGTVVPCTKQGMITIQQGATCTYTVQPPSASYAGNGGSGAISITASSAQCTPTVSIGAAWVHVTGTTTSGTQRTVTYTVDENTTATSRQTTIAVGTQSVTISEREAIATSQTPPIIFIHGWCSDASALTTLIRNLQQTTGIAGPRYGRTTVDIYYDGTTVRELTTNSATIPISRIYNMEYYNTGTRSTAKPDTANVRIEQLAYQLGRIVDQVRYVNNAEVVDLVAHSLGGLVARALVQGFADTSPALASQPDHALPGDPSAIRMILTLDTPHGGASGPSWSVWPDFTPCVFANNIQRDEMDPENPSTIIAKLNAHTHNFPTLLTAIASQFENGVTSNTDQVVTYPAQLLSAQQGWSCDTKVWDVDNTLTITGINPCLFVGFLNTPLHSCVHELPRTAALVNTWLSAARQTPTPGGCLALNPTTIYRAPTTTTVGPQDVTLTLRFDSSASQQVSVLNTCTADVTVLAGDATLVTRSVEMTGTQTVRGGIVETSSLRWELRSTCSGLVAASWALITPVPARIRAAKH